MRFNFLISSTILVLISFISACGGGGGGADGGSGGGLSITISTTEVNLTAGKNDPAPTAGNIRVSVSGGEAFLMSSSTINAINGHRLDCPFTTYCDLLIFPKTPSRLSIGNYTDTVSLTACSDNACNNVIKTFTVTINTTITQGGAFSTTPATFNIKTRDGVAATPVNFDLNYAGGVVTTWNANINYITGSNWLSLSAMTGDATVTSNLTMNFSILPVGSYQAEIIFTSGGGDVTLTVPVQYTVDYIRTTPEQLSFLVNTNSVPAEFSQNVIVNADFGAESAQSIVDWNAVTTAVWLSIVPASGDTGALNQFTAALQQNIIQTLANGIYNSTITLSSNDVAIADVIIPVTLIVNLPRITHLAPSVGYANQTNTIVLRGTGLTGITAVDILIGTQNPTLVEAIDDKSVRVTYPALAIGDYNPSVTDRFTNLYASTAVLSILAKPTLPNVELARTGTVQRVIYDEKRQAIYVLDRLDNEIERYRYVINQWVMDSLALGIFPFDFTLAKDNSEIVVLSTNLIHVDPVTFTVSDTVTTPIQFGFQQITAMNDGQALLIQQSANPYLYDIKAKSFTQLDSSFRTNSPSTIASTDGNRLFIATRDTGSIFRFDANTDLFTRSPQTTGDAYRIKTDRTGSKLVMSRSSLQVYDGNLNFLGTLPGFYNGALLSPDGLTAYAYDTGATSQLHVIDLTNKNASNVFTLTSTSPLSAPLGLNDVDITSTSDGAVLIFAGKKLVVRNLP